MLSSTRHIVPASPPSPYRPSVCWRIRGLACSSFSVLFRNSYIGAKTETMRLVRLLSYPASLIRDASLGTLGRSLLLLLRHGKIGPTERRALRKTSIDYRKCAAIHGAVLSGAHPLREKSTCRDGRPKSAQHSPLPTRHVSTFLYYKPRCSFAPLSPLFWRHR